MRAHLLFKQYVWLVDTIRRSHHITLAELSELWMRTDLGDGTALSRTTFNRHRSAVEDLFGITINCDSENRYYISDNDLLRSDKVQQWMLDTLTVSNIVGEVRSLHDRILLENIPTEGELLRQVIESMKRGVCIVVKYRRYGAKEESVWIVEPYCIKLFRRRWYLLCRFESGDFRMLSFDRILELELSDKSFVVDPEFDANVFFSEYYGVMTDSRIKLQRIVVRAYGNERFALQDLPLHNSQRLIEKTDDYVDFELFLRPTSDFLAHILSRGRWVEVISPENIAKEISDLHKESIK